jgi:putative DNA primase/helicase
VLDTVIALRKPQDHQADQGARFEVHFEKNRGFHGADANSFEATFGAGGWSMRDLAEADMARLAVLSANGMSVRDIAEETGMSKSKVGRLLKRASEIGTVPSPAHG